MHLAIAFAVFFIAASAVMVMLQGYARHMGNMEPADWGTNLVVSAMAALLGTGAFAILWEIASSVAGLLW